MNFGDRVQKARDLAKLTQRQLADQADLRPSTIGNIEQGRTKKSPHTPRLARVLVVRTEWLANGEEPMRPVPLDPTTRRIARDLAKLSGPQKAIIAAEIGALAHTPEHPALDRFKFAARVAIPE